MNTEMLPLDFSSFGVVIFATEWSWKITPKFKEGTVLFLDVHFLSLMLEDIAFLVYKVYILHFK